MNFSNSADVINKDFDKKRRKLNNDGVDMEITFNMGFEDIGNKILQKNEEKDETLWEKYQRKRKEKKKISRELRKKKTGGDDFFITEEKINEKKIASKAELELLVDSSNKNEFKTNVEDNRFEAIYNNSKYPIDPTHKNYKSLTHNKFLKEQLKRRKNYRKLQENNN